MKKKGMMSSTLIGWIIAITILALILVFSFVLKDQLIAMLGKLRAVFRG